MSCHYHTSLCCKRRQACSVQMLRVYNHVETSDQKIETVSEYFMQLSKTKPHTRDSWNTAHVSRGSEITAGLTLRHLVHRIAHPRRNPLLRFGAPLQVVLLEAYCWSAPSFRP